MSRWYGKQGLGQHFGEDRDGFCRKSVTVVGERHQVKGHLKREVNEKGKCRVGDAEWDLKRETRGEWELSGKDM